MLGLTAPIGRFFRQTPMVQRFAIVCTADMRRTLAQYANAGGKALFLRRFSGASLSLSLAYPRDHACARRGRPPDPTPHSRRF